MYQLSRLTTAVILIVIILGLFVNVSGTQENVDSGNKNAILLKNAQFDTGKMPEKASMMSTQMDGPEADLYYIIQFKDHVRQEWKVEIEDSGAAIYNYIPNNAFITRMNTSTRMEVESFEFVQWVGKYEPSYIISFTLIETLENTPPYEAESEDIIIVLFDKGDIGTVSENIIDLGCEIVDTSEDTIHARTKLTRIYDIAKINGIVWIDRYSQPSIMNDVSADITNIQYIQDTRGLTGRDQIVAIMDTGLDTGFNNDSMHDDLEGRIVALYDISDNNSSDLNGHGTHVAGSIASNGSLSNGQYKGMAPQAEIYFQAAGDESSDINVPSSLKSIFRDAYNGGARIHSNSWGFGDDTASSYTSYSRDVDSFMWNNPQMLIVFAGGNYGPNSNTVVSPGTAKNAITVGASENLRPGVGKSNADNKNDVASFSSRGPTDDGRIKPDLVAPGSYIISTRSSIATNIIPYNEYYSYDSGSSMAVPMVSGASALVRQYYIENESITPSASLIKATLINGVYDTGYSKEAQGWGRLDIERSLFPEPTGRILFHDEISLNTTQSWNTTYNVVNSSEPLCITLVWTDYPADPSAAITLVNDLNLKVTGPDSEYLGNGEVDSLNNVEHIELESPTAGPYRIEVTGNNVPQGPQPFSLVISGAIRNEPIILTATAEPSTIEADGKEDTTFAISVKEPDEIRSITMDLSAIGGNATQALHNNSNLWQYTTNTTSLGTFDLRINVTDKRGVSNTSSNITLTTLDTIPPTSDNPDDIKIFNHTQDSFIQWKLFDIHPGYYWIVLNGKQTSAPNPWTNTTNITVEIDTYMDEGDYNYTIAFNDSSGNPGQDIVMVTIPNTIPPKASDESPANYSYINGNSINIAVNVTDSTGLNENSISMTVNGAMVNTVKAPIYEGFRVSSEKNIGIGHAQEAEVVVSAQDRDRNTMEYEWSFFTDNEKPVIEINSLSEGHSTTFETINISGTFDGTGSSASLTINGIEIATGYNGSFLKSLKLSEGDNTIYINATDLAGNTNYTSVNVTRNIALTSTAKEESTGNGGGGGGGGGTTGEAYENIIKKEVMNQFINKGEVSYEFNEEINSIEYIRFKALKNSGKITSTIEVLKKKSSKVNSDPENIVYQNINIWLGKAGFATEHNIADPVIGFRVEKEWVNENDINESTIKLNRYHEDRWDSLPTTKTGEDEKYNYFESHTPGFSPFAITGDTIVLNSPVSADKEIIPDEPTDTAEEMETEPVETPMFSWALVLMIMASASIYTKRMG